MKNISAHIETALSKEIFRPMVYDVKRFHFALETFADVKKIQGMTHGEVECLYGMYALTERQLGKEFKLVDSLYMKLLIL